MESNVNNIKKAYIIFVADSKQYRNSKINIDNIKFTGNSTELLNSGGGAVSVGKNTTAQISNAEFSSNTSEGMGGALYVVDGSSMTVSDSTLKENIAGTTGGAIYADNGGEVIINNSVISANEAYEGSAIYIGETSSVTLNDTDVTDNTGRSSIYNEGTLNINSSEEVTVDNPNGEEKGIIKNWRTEL